MPRSRKDIIAAILKLTDQRSYDYMPYPFCFNVKMYRVNLDLDNLLAIHKESEDIEKFDPDWLEKINEKYEEVSTDQLYDWGLEDARAYFVEWCNTDKPCDTMVTTEDGIKCEGVTYSFEGRSGGWLSLNTFEGYNFNDRNSDIEETLAEMPFQELRKLYKLISTIAKQVGGNNPEQEVEYQAAFNFFQNYCSDVKADHVYKREPAST